MTPQVAKCLLVSKVLVADGMMGDDEREFLAAVMTKLGLTEAERHKVIQLEGLSEAEPYVTGLPEEERRELLDMMMNAASADGHLSPHELRTVKKVAAALGLK